MERLSTEALNSSGCVWAGYSSLAEAFKQRHSSPVIDLTVDDGVLKRDFVYDRKARWPRLGSLPFTWPLGSSQKMSPTHGMML